MLQEYSEVLVIDDQPERCKTLQVILDFIGESYRVVAASNASECLTQSSLWHAVVIGDIDGAEESAFLSEVIKQAPQQPFLLLGKAAMAKLSAPNLLGELAEPFNQGQFLEMLHRCQDYRLKRPSARPTTPSQTKLFRSLVGRSLPMQQVRQLIEQVAVTEASVLVLGSSGTGKEVVARNIHYLSERREGPFVPVNCGAIPGELLESELFGHEKGAFTGAVAARKGRFELAQGGTLFLDEIGDMPLNMQVKLLRVLQERVYERVGGNKPIKADVRIVAATHRQLENMIDEGKFREDLFYRLNVFPIEMPSLKERSDDIPLLLQELVSRLQSEHRAAVKFTERAIESLMLHHWSGNVRELSNLVERLVILYPNGVVDVGDLPQKYQYVDAPAFEPEYSEELLERESLAALFAEDAEPLVSDPALPAELPPEGVNLKEMLADLEIDMINQALEQSDGVVARAAEMLGMRRTTLVEKMRKYKISKDD